MKRPMYAFGDLIEDANGFRGRVDAMFRNYESAVQCGVVPRDWWERQAHRPSVKDQVFYSVVADEFGAGAVLLGENDVVSLVKMRGGAV